MQLPVPDGVLSRFGHSTVAIELAPGLTEVTALGGCPQYNSKKLPDDQPRLAETIVMTFGKFTDDIIIPPFNIMHYMYIQMEFSRKTIKCS